MSLTHVTEPFDKDGRLKIFWLDDKRDELFQNEREKIPETQRFSPWFAITSATDLADVRAIGASQPQISGSHEYDRPEAPYDVYVLDFRLCDVKEHCKSTAHIEEGLHAPAAGLLAGIFTAQKWPNHPQAVIPYSGYSDEIGDVWTLCWQFRTRDLYLADVETAKNRQDFSELLAAKVAVNYRKALGQSFASGAATIPLGARETLELDLVGEEWISADAEIEIATVFGLRNFKLGALFFDHKKRVAGKTMVPSAAVRRELLDLLPAADAIAVRARQIAELFWQLRGTTESFRTYATLRRGEEPTTKTSFPWLGDRSWRPSKRNLAPEGARVIRLAILFLILFEHQARIARSHVDMRDDMRQVLKYLDDCLHSGEAPEALIAAFMRAQEGKAEDLLERLDNVLEAVAEWGDIDAIDLVALKLPLSELDVVQLVDPLPSSPFSTSFSEEYKVGNGLAERLSGAAIGQPDKTINLGQLLHGDANTTRRMLLESEWAALSRVAGEILKQGDMPTWLSDRGQH